VDAALLGDDAAFTELVRRHKRRVFGLAGRFSRSEHERDDLSQDIFLKVYENLRQFRRDAPFEHWLSKIAVRTCYDALRKRRSERLTVPLEDAVRDLSDRRVAERQEAAESRNLLRWALEQLKPAERLIITLLELEEKSVREVAGLTGWTEVNVKVRAWRARQALKKILEADHVRYEQ